MSRLPDLSVVIPTHNRAQFIGQTLESVFNQTFDGQIEVMIVDDGSTDSTSEVVQPYLKGADRVRVHYRHVEKAGVVAARNHALAQSSAPWVAFLDSDDLWEATKIERQLTQADDENVGVVHTDFRYIDDSGQFLDAHPQRPDNPAQGWCAQALLAEDTVIFSSVLMRREIIDAIAAIEGHKLPFDPRWTNGQDYDLLLRAALQSPFAYVAEPLTHYRTHAHQNAMGNFHKVFGFHCRVQIDFAVRHGHRLDLTERDGRHAAAEFLWRRANSLYWQRELKQTQQLCDLAAELGFDETRFQQLRRQAQRPRWLLRLKDRLDRLRRKSTA